MSVDAWVIATRTHLRTELVSGGHIPGGAVKAKHYVDIQPGGHPPAAMGEFYIAVDEVGTQQLDHDKLHEVYRLDVTISKRTGQYAPDKYGDMYAKNARTIRQLERAVIVAIHNNHVLRIAVNAELGAPSEVTGDACINPMWHTGTDKTRPEGPAWCGGNPDSVDAFLVRVVHFGGGRRIQDIDVMA